MSNTEFVFFIIFDFYFSSHVTIPSYGSLSFVHPLMSAARICLSTADHIIQSTFHFYVLITLRGHHLAEQEEQMILTT